MYFGQSTDLIHLHLHSYPRTLTYIHRFRPFPIKPAGDYSAYKYEKKLLIIGSVTAFNLKSEVVFIIALKHLPVNSYA